MRRVEGKNGMRHKMFMMERKEELMPPIQASWRNRAVPANPLKERKLLDIELGKRVTLQCLYEVELFNGDTLYVAKEWRKDFRRSEINVYTMRYELLPYVVFDRIGKIAFSEFQHLIVKQDSTITKSVSEVNDEAYLSFKSYSKVVNMQFHSLSELKKKL